ncbi:putative toxin-antitoxin system toxin component, PIN family [Aquiflexum sp.]|uniref:putative toxin-antitoxin system toxin component, PIN family n=1 Tax=Aquiflexum sp. TaxID=1872584 RepID=UPI0035944EF0
MISRFVLDTNTIISAVLSPFSTNAEVLKKSLLIGAPVFSENVFNELNEVILRKKFDRYFSIKDRIRIIESLRSRFLFVEVSSNIHICRDPKDDMFLNLAIDAKATCIVTGDADLLELNPFKGIPILSPREFLEKYQNMV